MLWEKTRRILQEFDEETFVFYKTLLTKERMKERGHVAERARHKVREMTPASHMGTGL